MKKLKETNNYKFPINTFGFGQYTRLNSKLLNDIATLYDGMFGYIPDPTNLGTIFVNGISNILTTGFHDVTLSLNFPKGTKIESLQTGAIKYEISPDKCFVKIHIGGVRYG